MNCWQVALEKYGRHLGWCQINAQMPQEIGRTYTIGGPNCEYTAWRDKQPCTCGWDTAKTLIHSVADTEGKSNV